MKRESGAEDNEGGDSDFKEKEEKNIYKDHEAKLIKF